MKVAIVTGDDPHHKHLCVRLAENHNVVGILHPVVRGVAGRLRRLRNWARTYGWPLALLSASAAAPDMVSGWTMRAELARAEERHYGRFVAEYEKLDPRLIHREVDVRSTAARELLGRLDPDVVVALGGPIYPPELIASCRLILNFHSGISPIYNGSSTINFAFANGHPHLCGGTLMKMSAVIDGGAILAHYLPSIEADDSPVSLFMKTVGGAATLYERFLSANSAGVPLRCIPQAPPLFYYRYSNWSLYQSQLVAHYLRTGLAGKHLRSERIVEYWNASTDEDAHERYRRTIDNLLWGNPA
jgi:folate-dependent phosphoribosylglycinamide formyltransferase PurN